MAHFSFVVDGMHQDIDTLKQILEPAIKAMGYELVGIEFHPSRTSALLRLYIDAQSGISVDDCQLVSHQVSGLLDVEDPISNRYTLEVSSPGLDRPLFTPEHFSRFAGHEVRIQLSMPIEGRKKVRGRLLGMRGEEVMVEADGQNFLLPLEHIKRARLVPEL